ncbi:MAG: hypothetical protein AB1765_01135 [Candidatus Hydrogenedentota bacterium]
MSDIHTEKLILADSFLSAERIVSKIKNKEKFKWTYIGRDYVRYQKFSLKFGEKGSFISLSKKLDEVSDSLRKPFMEWLDELNYRYESDIIWWFTSVSGRNTLGSDLFLNICYLFIIEELIKSNNLPAVIIYEDKKVIKEAEKIFQKHNIDFRRIWSFPFAGHLKNVLRPFCLYIKFIFNLLIIKFSAFITRCFIHKEYSHNNSSIMVLTYLTDKDFDKDGIFKDKYFPFLYEWLKNNGYNFCLLPHLFNIKNYWRVFQCIRKSNIRFIVEYDYINIFDYIAIFLYSFKIFVKNFVFPVFIDKDISALCKSELKSINNILSIVSGITKYRLAMKLFKSNIKPEIFILWYENQIKDKAIIYGIRKFLPDTKITGLQSFVYCPNYLFLYPLQSEVKFKIVPDKILVTGKLFCDIAKNYSSDVKCGVAPALRYSYLYKNNTTLKISRDKKIVLVLSPYSTLEASEFLLQLSEAIDGRNELYLLKVHPDINQDKFIDILKKLRILNNYRIFGENLTDGFRMADVVISTASGTALEALTFGIPVILIAKLLSLTFNPLVYVREDIWRVCYTPEEINKTLDYYLRIDEAVKRSFIQIGKNIRQDYFEPINDEGLKEFVTF